MNWFGLFRKSTPLRDQRAAPPSSSAEPTGASPPLAAPAADAPTPEAVRKLLFDAVAAGDEFRLESLCQEYKDLLLAHGAGWLDVPEAFRASPAAYEWYGNGLRAIARFCAEKLGRDEFVQRLENPTSTHA